jgi:hypothetical protein
LPALALGLYDGSSWAQAPDGYEREIEDWRAARVERLKSEDGWLTLVGLHWLVPGKNRFGTDPDGEIVLPAGRAPAYAGSLFLEQGAVRVQGASGLTLAGEPVVERALKTDAGGEPDVLELGDLRLHIIEREGRFGVRVKNPRSPVRLEFRGLDYFPVNPRLRVVAEFVPYEKPRQVLVATVIGTESPMQVPGRVRFELDGKALTLEPVLEEDRYWFLFKDATNGRETYPAGRYLYGELQGAGKLVLDFNKAYNPPCAFTPYATCPLPPKRNWLDVRIEAGEKTYGAHH